MRTVRTEGRSPTPGRARGRLRALAASLSWLAGLTEPESVPTVPVVDEIQFAWDPRKDRDNQRKHGVSFAEARTVFYDPQADEFCDEERAVPKDRFLLLG